MSPGPELTVVRGGGSPSGTPQRVGISWGRKIPEKPAPGVHFFGYLITLPVGTKSGPFFGPFSALFGGPKLRRGLIRIFVNLGGPGGTPPGGGPGGPGGGVSRGGQNRQNRHFRHFSQTGKTGGFGGVLGGTLWGAKPTEFLAPPGGDNPGPRVPSPPSGSLRANA